MLNTIKTELSELLHLSKDALHIHLGLGIYVAVMVFLRRGPGSWLPWLTVLAFELLNEMLDAWHHGITGIAAPGSLKDIFNTMLWPTVLLLGARIAARKRAAVARRNPAPAAPAE